MTQIHALGPLRRQIFTDTLILLRRAARELAANDPLRLGAATAFFTTFALPPILIILIQVMGSLYSASTVRSLLLMKLSSLLGAPAAGLVEQILQNVTNVQRSRLVTWLGFGFLLFISTTLFVVIQHSLNQLWQIRPRRSGGQLGKALKERTRSLGMLLATGLLSILAFLTDAALAFVADYVRDFDANFGYYLFQVCNQITSLLILAAWFAVTFRNLSSARALANGVARSRPHRRPHRPGRVPVRLSARAPQPRPHLRPGFQHGAGAAVRVLVLLGHDLLLRRLLHQSLRPLRQHGHQTQKIRRPLPTGGCGRMRNEELGMRNCIWRRSARFWRADRSKGAPREQAARTTSANGDQSARQKRADRSDD